jgi:hypothetical protein
VHGLGWEWNERKVEKATQETLPFSPPALPQYNEQPFSISTSYLSGITFSFRSQSSLFLTDDTGHLHLDSASYFLSARINMLPWRPIGMLTFGLNIIFLFVRLHGDGYDLPVLVAKCDKKLEQSKPSRTFLEISGVYHDQFRDWPKEQDQDGSIPIQVPLSSASAAASSSHASSSSSENVNNHSQQQKEQGRGLKFGVGWNSQWQLGRKKLPADAAADGGEGVPTNRQVDETQEADQKYQNEQGAGQDGYTDSERWIWMTNVWLEDSDSGSGEGNGMMGRIDKSNRGKRSTLEALSWRQVYIKRT